ncbi:Signal transduction histidine kinase [Caloranaerobacter azorensis DSM 13643]|uniref:histidine kinase n=2 Tax=Caloranaerobacter azorensis TaxID=116090 RepID=A0A1M5RGL6_9FIRM|nr:Signal transduction histidine kinase [Caloranaerobacter azorensis DSM 13643]
MVNMKKIGNKIILSYFLILLIVFLVTSITFNYLSKKYLVMETRIQLREEGQKIAEILRNVNLQKGDFKNINLSRRQLRLAGKFIDSEVLVINREGKIVYRDLKDLNQNVLYKLLKFKQSTLNGYIVERVVIKDKNQRINGYVFLFARIKNIHALNRLMRQTQSLSFIIASIIALFIGIIFQKNISKPIKMLKEKMINFSIDNFHEYPDINTGDEIEELDKSFKEMAERIKRYNKQQKIFLQNTSHELKTPLMSIQGYAEAIKDGVVEGKELEESLNIIIEESQRLKKTVDEIIYLVKIENVEENFNFEEVDLSEIIFKSIKTIKSLADEKNINIDVQIEKECIVKIDSEKMMRALVNILGNCIRYAENKISINARYKYEKTEIIIKDDGEGFKDGEENKIFERFYKGRNGSTGIGLAITKAIIERHNGNVYAYNGTPKGAVFKIELPKVDCSKY